MKLQTYQTSYRNFILLDPISETTLIDAFTYFISLVDKVHTEEIEKYKKVGSLKGYWFAFVFRDKDDNFKTDIETYLRFLELTGFAYIYHDKDESETKHFHLLIHTKNQKTILSLSKLFKCSVYDIERVTYPQKFMRYLIHLDDKDKHQYNTYEVIHNFDNFNSICSDSIGGACDSESINTQTIIGLILHYKPKTFREFVLLVGAEFPNLLGFVNRHAYFINALIRNESVTYSRNQKIEH